MLNIYPLLANFVTHEKKKGYLIGININYCAITLSGTTDECKKKPGVVILISMDMNRTYSWYWNCQSMLESYMMN